MKGWIVACPEHKIDMVQITKCGNLEVFFCAKCLLHYWVLLDRTKILEIRKEDL